MLTRLFHWATSWQVIRVVLWILHALLVVAIVLGLYAINQRYRLETDLLSPFPRLHPYWLPVLFVLVYAGGWLGWWFFKLLTDSRTGEFPDIDAAWAAGLAALNAAGIEPREVPLFLLVGKPRSGTADFFAATRLPFAVRAEPRRADAPIRVYATREAAFVTCEGACVLARLADLLAVRPAPAVVQPVPAASGPVDLLDSPGAPAEVIAGEPRLPVPDAAERAPPPPDTWLPRPGADRAARVPSDEAARLARRLTYLCRQIAERRRPYCPANGIIWLLPVAATESEPLADQAAAAGAADRVAAETGLQVHCPAAAVVCDAQELTGFRDLLRGLPEARERLLGRSFPLVPGVPPGQWPAVLADGTDWVARHLVPGVVYQRFGSEAEGTGERWSGANARLWELTAELFARRAAVARLLAQGVADGTSRPPMLAGAYLAATGPDEQDQAFAAGVVRQLIVSQNSVAWTDAAEAEERDHRRMTGIGYAAALALAVAVLTFGYATWR
jgi:hypothetical protein